MSGGGFVLGIIRGVKGCLGILRDERGGGHRWTGRGQGWRWQRHIRDGGHGEGEDAKRKGGQRWAATGDTKGEDMKRVCQSRD